AGAPRRISMAGFSPRGCKKEAALYRKRPISSARSASRGISRWPASAHPGRIAATPQTEQILSNPMSLSRNFSRNLPHHLIIGVLIALALSTLTGCSPSDRLQQIRDAGVLRVVTRNGPTTYYEDRHGPAGLEYELAKRFAKELGVELRIDTEASYEAIFDAVDKGRVDIAAAGLAVSAKRREKVVFGPSYREVEHLVIVRADRQQPKQPGDLLGLQIAVAAGSARAAAVRALKDSLPALSWTESSDVETIDLLDQL